MKLRIPVALWACVSMLHGMTLSPAPYCLQLTNGSVVSTSNLLMDATTNYFYLTLPMTASKSYVDIWDLISTINSTG